MKYYIVAGEASGDLHGANLISAIRRIDHQARFRVWGGERMQLAGAELVKHYRDHAFMGLFPVLVNIRTIKRNFEFCHHDMVHYAPDVVILIDYSGFNLRIAKMAKEAGLIVFYYISPQVWAWRQHRVKKIKAFVDKMFVILPFEKEFYAGWDYQVEYHGHPLLDAIGTKVAAKPRFSEFVAANGLSGKPVVALLPGSRKQEILVMLPLMLSVAERFPEFEFVIAGMSSADPQWYASASVYGQAVLLKDKTHEILQQATAALVTSGTATLETALFGVPQVVCYKGGALTYHIVKRLVKIKYISIVNLIMDREVVKELIQNDLTTERIEGELRALLYDTSHRKAMQADYRLLEEKLGGPGASERVATAMHNCLVEKR